MNSAPAEGPEGPSANALCRLYSSACINTPNLLACWLFLSRSSGSGLSLCGICPFLAEPEFVAGLLDIECLTAPVAFPRPADFTPEDPRPNLAGLRPRP